MIHTVKGFGTVNKAVDVFLELSCFFDDLADVSSWSLVSLPFLKPACTSGSSWFTYCWSLAWRMLSITLLACEMSAKRMPWSSKYPFPTTQEKTLHRDITRWSTPKSDWLYSLQPKMEKLHTVSKNKTRSWLWLRSWTPYCQIQT